MKSFILVLAIFLLVPALLRAQWYENLRDIGPPMNAIQRTQHFVRNTGFGGVPLRLMFETRDTVFFRLWSDSLIVNYLGSSNHGYPSGNLMWTDGIGTVRGTPLSSMFFADSSIVATRNWVNTRGFLTTEVDPVWTAASGNYFTKTQSDARYLQSFTETDPLFDTKFAAKSTTDLTEGTNLYYTVARFNTAFATKSTTDLAEGINQYFTTARARLSLSGGTGISYNNSSGVITNSAPDQTVVLTNGTGVSNTGTYPNFTITNTAPDQTVTIASGTGISATGTYPNFTVTNTAPAVAPVTSTPTRVLSTTGANNTFTISASRPSFVSYSINIAYALTLVTSNGLVDLDYSTNGGSSWVPVASVSNAYTVAITLTGNANAVLAGFIPTNALVRINRVSNTNVTITIVRQQETTL